TMTTMPNPTVLSTRRIAMIDVVGHIWQGQTCAYSYALSDHDLKGIGTFDRDSFSDWLDTHAGDFESIQDFAAYVGDQSIAWASEDAECLFINTMYPED
ncbi:MAG: hypothetical protein WAP47_08635, partial [Candidatus Rokuibacteriota bacterium]